MKGLLVLAMVAIGCGDDGGGGGGPGPDAPYTGGLPTVGEPASGTIGAAGGTLTSADGRLTLVFPAGALAEDTAIEVQEVTVEGGRGWALSPDGLTPAMPVRATITLPDTEVEAPARMMVDGEEVLDVPVPWFVHIPSGTGPFSDLEVTAAWRETEAELDYAFDLPHFSVVAYLYAGRQSMGSTASIPVGFGFDIAMRQTSPPRPVPLLFRCGEMLRTQTFDVRFIPSAITVTDNEEVQPDGGSGVLSDESGWAVSASCDSVGLDVFSATARIRPALADWSNPRVEGCALEESFNNVRRELRVDCVDRVCTGSDPVDVSMVANGDPSVDIVCATTGTFTRDALPWVRLVVAGPWRPSSEFYSWFTRITLFGASGQITYHTIQHHDGVDEILEGAVRANTHTEEDNGYYVIWPASLSGMITMVTVESGIMKEPPPTGVFVPDTVMSFAFDPAVRTPR